MDIHAILKLTGGLIAMGLYVPMIVEIIRARGAVELLPAILEALHGVDAHPGEVRLRTNTLEDVFISLTGRRLRE